jgi:hypothetical protein
MEPDSVAAAPEDNSLLAGRFAIAEPDDLPLKVVAVLP